MLGWLACLTGEAAIATRYPREFRRCWYLVRNVPL